MFETVLILGAGVSKPAGAPLMKEFIDTAEDIFKVCATDLGQCTSHITVALTNPDQGPGHTHSVPVSPLADRGHGLSLRSGSSARRAPTTHCGTCLPRGNKGRFFCSAETNARASHTTYVSTSCRAASVGTVGRARIHSMTCRRPTRKETDGDQDSRRTASDGSHRSRSTSEAGGRTR